MYQQSNMFNITKNTCCFSSLSSALYDAIEHVAEQVIASRLGSYFFYESFVNMDRIKFVNKIMADHVSNKG